MIRDIYYDSQSIEKEIQIFINIIKNYKSKTILHNINGERDLRYSLKYLSTLSKVSFISSFHKPKSILKKIFEINPYIKKIDGAIALGTNQKEFLIDNLPFSKVKLIHHGVDTNFFKPSNAIDNDSRCSILFVGQHLRNFEVLNQVVDVVKNIEVDINIVIHPTYLQFLRNKKYLNIFTGIGDTKLRNLYRRSLCLFLPFKDVTACNSILESLACGTPIITNKIGDNIDYLDEKCAIFAKDKNSFIDSIKYIIKNKDSEDYKDMRQEARNKALNFDWNLISQKIEKFYKEIS